MPDPLTTSEDNGPRFTLDGISGAWLLLGDGV